MGLSCKFSLKPIHWIKTPCLRIVALQVWIVLIACSKKLSQTHFQIFSKYSSEPNYFQFCQTSVNGVLSCSAPGAFTGSLCCLAMAFVFSVSDSFSTDSSVFWRCRSLCLWTEKTGAICQLLHHPIATHRTKMHLDEVWAIGWARMSADPVLIGVTLWLCQNSYWKWP